MSEFVPTTEHVRDLALRLISAAEFDRWLDQVKAEARREGQVEALRAAANVKNPEFPTEDWYGSSDYVRTWLHARANQIENGVDQ